jgi:hypothetical protein
VTSLVDLAGFRLPYGNGRGHHSETSTKYDCRSAKAPTVVEGDNSLRETISCAKLKAAHWSTVPARAIQAPITMVYLRPSLFPRYMVLRHPTAAPRLRHDTEAPWMSELCFLIAPVVVAVLMVGKRV